MKTLGVLLLIIGFSLSVRGQNEKPDYNKWVVGGESGIGIGTMTFDLQSTSFNWWNAGVKVEHMLNSKFGIGSGLYFMNVNTNDNRIVVDEYYRKTTYSGMVTQYVDVPINVVLRPGFNRKRGNAGFIFNAGLWLNFPVNETGTKHVEEERDDWLGGDINEKSQMDGGVYFEPRIYITANPGFYYAITNKVGMDIRLKTILNPIPIYDTDFQYDVFIGLSLGLALY